MNVFVHVSLPFPLCPSIIGFLQSNSRMRRTKFLWLHVTIAKYIIKLVYDKSVKLFGDLEGVKV